MTAPAISGVLREPLLYAIEEIVGHEPRHRDDLAARVALADQRFIGYQLTNRLPAPFVAALGENPALVQPSCHIPGRIEPLSIIWHIFRT